MSTFSSQKSKELENISIIKLLGEPIRSRIFLEVLLNKEVSTNELLERINISKGTMSHHLTKLVNAGLLEVKIQSTGRPLKYYSLRQKTKIVYDEKHKKSDKVQFFQSATAQIQMIANMMKETSIEISSNKLGDTKVENFTFTMQIVSAEAAKIIQTKFREFMKDLTEELKKIENENEDYSEEQNHFFFSGLFPILQ